MNGKQHKKHHHIYLQNYIIQVMDNTLMYLIKGCTLIIFNKRKKY